MGRRAVAEGLVAGEADALRLIGGRDSRTGEVIFPLPSGPERARFEPIELSSDGVLWSFTVQRFAPKPPYLDAGAGTFRPYVVGYVELPEGIAVEARILADPGGLAIGQPMRLTSEVIGRGADGDELTTYAFRPA